MPKDVSYGGEKPEKESMSQAKGKNGNSYANGLFSQVENFLYETGLIRDSFRDKQDVMEDLRSDHAVEDYHQQTGEEGQNRNESGQHKSNQESAEFESGPEQNGLVSNNLNNAEPTSSSSANQSDVELAQSQHTEPSYNNVVNQSGANTAKQSDEELAEFYQNSEKGENEQR